VAVVAVVVSFAALVKHFVMLQVQLVTLVVLFVKMFYNRLKTMLAISFNNL
jgi:hypothetical protein